MWFFFLPVFQAVISQTQKLLVRRDLEITYFLFLVCFVFHAVARLSVARHFFSTLHCVFLLASHLSQGNQKISLPALSTSSIFYDPSICNLMVVEFPLPMLTLGRVPLGCSETHGQSLQSSLALFGASDSAPYILLCASWPSVQEWALQSSS